MKRSRDILAENLYVQLIKTQEKLQSAPLQLMRKFGITPQQYNVLRVLYVRGEFGLSPSEIIPYMINRVPDMTRLLDRLERDKFIRRERSETDRRKIKVYLNHEGEKLCEELDQPLIKTVQEVFNCLDPQEQRTLYQLLVRLEQGPAQKRESA